MTAVRCGATSRGAALCGALTTSRPPIRISFHRCGDRGQELSIDLTKLVEHFLERLERPRSLIISVIEVTACAFESSGAPTVSGSFAGCVVCGSARGDQPVPLGEHGGRASRTRRA